MMTNPKWYAKKITFYKEAFDHKIANGNCINYATRSEISLDMKVTALSLIKEGLLTESPP